MKERGARKATGDSSPLCSAFSASNCAFSSGGTFAPLPFGTCVVQQRRRHGPRGACEADRAERTSGRLRLAVASAPMKY